MVRGAGPGVAGAEARAVAAVGRAIDSVAMPAWRSSRVMVVSPAGDRKEKDQVFCCRVRWVKVGGTVVVGTGIGATAACSAKEKTQNAWVSRLSVVRVAAGGSIVIC